MPSPAEILEGLALIANAEREGSRIGVNVRADVRPRPG